LTPLALGRVINLIVHNNTCSNGEWRGDLRISFPPFLEMKLLSSAFMVASGDLCKYGTSRGLKRQEADEHSVLLLWRKKKPIIVRRGKGKGENTQSLLVLY
jgi:hypothetical protein